MSQEQEHTVWHTHVGMCVPACVCVCGSGMLICFVSAQGSHEMGRHKLPIIIIIILLLDKKDSYSEQADHFFYIGSCEH